MENSKYNNFKYFKSLKIEEQNFKLKRRFSFKYPEVVGFVLPSGHMDINILLPETFSPDEWEINENLIHLYKSLDLIPPFKKESIINYELNENLNDDLDGDRYYLHIYEDVLLDEIPELKNELLNKTKEEQFKIKIEKLQKCKIIFNQDDDYFFYLHLEYLG